MKTVSQLDANGYFIGPAIAYKSPLDYDLYLIPGGAIDVPPPTVPAGKVALRHKSSWVFITPPEPDAPPPVNGIPQSVTMRQARLALLAKGKLAMVEPAIDALPSPQKEAARIEWEYSAEVHRGKPFVQLLGAAIGLDDAALDELFTEAALL